MVCGVCTDGTRGGLRGLRLGLTDQSFEAASDLPFITGTPRWHLTVRVDRLQIFLMLFGGEEGASPARSRLVHPNSRLCRAGVKRFALNITRLVRGSGLDDISSGLRWKLKETRQLYLSLREGLAFWQEDSVTPQHPGGGVPIHAPTGIAFTDAFLTYMLRLVYDLRSLYFGCEMHLPLPLLTDNLIIPAMLLWVDSRHVDVGDVTPSAFNSLPPHEKISWLWKCTFPNRLATIPHKHRKVEIFQRDLWSFFPADFFSSVLCYIM